MEIMGSTVLPIVFPPEDKARDIPVRVVRDLPYAFILGASFFRSNSSVISLATGKGFQPSPGAPWVPFQPRHAATKQSWDRYCAVQPADDGNMTPAALPPLVPPLPKCSVGQAAWEDDGTLQWELRLSKQVEVAGFVGVVVEGYVRGAQPSELQLVLIQPVVRYDIDSGALVGMARGVQWWEPGNPLYCKVVNIGRAAAVVRCGHPIAKVIALNVRDEGRFRALFVHPAPAGPRPAPTREPSPVPDQTSLGATVRGVDLADANVGQLSEVQNTRLTAVLQPPNEAGVFPVDSKRVRACKGRELRIPLTDEACTPIAAKQQRFSPEQADAIQREVKMLADRGIIRKSTSAWAARCVTVRKKDGTLRLCQGYRALNSCMKTDSGGLGDMQGIFQRLQGCSWFTSIDLASGFFQLPIAEPDRHKTAFRDAFGQLWEYVRCGFGLKILPPAFASMVADLLGDLKSNGVENYLDDILIYSEDFDRHLELVAAVLSRLQSGGLSVNFAKSQWCCASLEFVGMVVDRQGVRPADSKIAAVAELSPPSTVEELRAFLGMTGYLRQYVEHYSILAAPLTDILRNKAFASKRARRTLIPWSEQHQQAFVSLKSALTSYPILAFPKWDKPFVLHTDASAMGAGAALTQEHEKAERVIAYASHRWSTTDARRGATERECMAVLWAVVHFRPYLAGRPFTLITDCSAITWMFRSRDLDPKLHRWALRLSEFDMKMQWRAGSSHQLPDALSRLLRLGPAAESIDDSFPDDETSGAPGDYVGPQGPVLDGVPLKDLEPAREGVVDPGGAREKRVVITANTDTSRPPALPSLLAAIVDSIPHTCQSTAALQVSGDEPGDDSRLLTLTYHDRLAALGAGAPTVEVRRSSRTTKPSVRLRPLPDHASRSVSVPLPASAPSSISGSPPTALASPRENRGDEPRQASAEVLPTGGAVTQQEPQRNTHCLSKRGEMWPHSEQPSNKAVVERALSALRDVPGLVRLQREDPFLGKVRQALGDEGGTGGLGKMNEEEATRYLLDDQNLVWYELELHGVLARRTSVLAVPRSMIADLLALVHCQHGHPGAGRTLSLLRDRFHWPGMCRDTREYVLSCGCRRRKRSRSQRIAMLPARHLEPWEVLEVDLQRIPNTSEAGNEYLLLVVDKASRFLFAYPLPSKEAHGVARLLLDLCLTFGVPSFIRADGGGEFTATVMEHLCRWLKVQIEFGPADHPRGQGSVERAGAWMHDVLSELCKAWPTRWDEYVAAACWIKRTMPDPALPSAMTPFQLLFGRSPRTSLDMLVPQMDDTAATGGLENFIEGRRHNLREVRDALEKMHKARENARQRHNAAIQRPSPGTRVVKGDLVLARESDSSLHRQGMGPKLVHDKWTGPWKVVKVVFEGFSAVIEMEGRVLRSRTVSTASLKPFYTRSSDLRHPMEDEFAQMAWGADLGLGGQPTTAAPMYTMLDRRRVVSSTGVARWEYRGRYLDGVESDWVSEAEALDSFTPLQLDTFHALWNLYGTGREKSRPPARNGGSGKKRPSLSRREALKRFPIGTKVAKPYDDGTGRGSRAGQVYDFYSPYWRVRFPDNDWEELTASEMKKFGV